MTKPYYDDGRGIVIYHGRAEEIAPGLSPDVIVTDPPYGIGWTRGVHAARNSKPHSGIEGDEDTSLRDAVLAMFPHVPAVVFGSFYAPYPQNVKQVLVWRKPPDSGVVGSTTGFRRDAEPIFIVGPWPQSAVRWSSVLISDGSISHVARQTGHPHTKPLSLMIQLIERCPPGVLLDPFMGSGSTLVAARLVGRRAIGIECDEKYAEIAAKRLQQEVLPLAAD